MIKSLNEYVLSKAKQHRDANVEIIFNGTADEYNANLLSVDEAGAVFALTKKETKILFYPWTSIRRISVDENDLLDDHVKYQTHDTPPQ
jgi:hypothetical protein